MRTTQTALLLLAVALTSSCALSGATLDWPTRPAPPVVDVPAPPTPPVETPTPDPPVVLEDLFILVRNAAAAPILDGYCLVAGERRRVENGDGVIHFPVPGPVVAQCAAPGYLLREFHFPPGRQNADLVAIAGAPPSAPPVTTPPTGGVIAPGRLSIAQVVSIAQKVHDAEGWHLGTGSSREQRNRFWDRAVGIVHFGHPIYNLTADPRWHIKDAGGGRPPSDDVVVLMPSREFWDCIPGAGLNGYGFRASFDGILPGEQNVYPPSKPAQGVVRP